MLERKVKIKHCFLIFIFTLLSCSSSDIVDPALTRIWGPGLEPQNIVMPARYFFIQAVDKNNQSILHSVSQPFQIVIEGGTKQGKPCRIWSNILDRKDGLYIARYKLYEECSNINIHVKYQNKPVAKSPYIVKDLVAADECYCPQENIDKLVNLWKCPEAPLQVLRDLKQFREIDWNILRPKVIKQFDKPHSVSLCHYVIKDNQVYRKCYGKYVGFNMFSDSILLSLARKVKLPDLEFFMNLGDWPLSTNDMPEKYPIFSWCGSSDTYDIVVPTYEITESALENMGRVMLDMLSVQGNVGGVWEKRQPKLFWRGRDSNRHRLDLIELSRERPDLFNVSLTNFFFYKNEEEIYGPKSDHVSFFQFFDYKYQLAIDGTVAAYRMPFLLGGGSLVFKPHSKYYEYFYGNLEPGTHYVPVKTDLKDLIEKIKWAKEQDEEAKFIAQNGQRFANENLLPRDVFCYYFHLLNEFSKIVTSKIGVLEGMELVKQKKVISCEYLEAKDKDEL